MTVVPSAAARHMARFAFILHQVKGAFRVAACVPARNVPGGNGPLCSSSGIQVPRRRIVDLAGGCHDGNRCGRVFGRGAGA